MLAIYPGGIRLKVASVKYQWVEDLIYFEGPILSYVRGTSQQDYFYLWVDNDDMLNRWLAIPVTREMIRGYKRRDLSLLSLIKMAGSVQFIDLDDDLKVKRAFCMDEKGIPEDILPEPDSFFDLDYCPTGSDVLQDSHAYYLGLDKQWFFEDVQVVEKRYKQTYSFIYTFMNMDRVSIIEKIKDIFRDYNWYGGSSRVHFFNDLDKNVPSMHEPKLEAFSYASPGHIKLELWADAAGKLGELAEKVLAQNDRVLQVVDDINIFLREKDLKTQGDQAILSSDSRKELFLLANELCDLLDLSEFKDSFQAIVSSNPIKYAKILLAFHRRLNDLLPFVERGMLKLSVKPEELKYHKILD